MEKRQSPWIVYLATFPPRECGIATFTRDMITALDTLFSPAEESRVVAMNYGEEQRFPYPKTVIDEIDQTVPVDYVRVARKLNDLPQVKLICIQHEFGIYGGDSGSNLLYFLSEIKKPVIVIFHTVMPSTSEYYRRYREVVKHIDDYTRRIIVMTETSRDILVNDYQISPDKIRVIPHGIHAGGYQSIAKAKALLKIDDPITLTTFGFLGRGKGTEYAIEAMPAIVARFPGAVYHIIGITHPMVVLEQGESYREELTRRVATLGLERHVIFHNEFFPTPKILQFLQATDIYLSLSLDANQAVSGTLSYALGSGRPVVSTAFAQAREDVTDEIGRLVGFRDPGAIAEAVIGLLEHPEARKQMGKSAYFRTRRMTWPNVSLSYMREFLSVIPGLRIHEKNLPKVKLRQFAKLTDDFGMFQFAELTEPDHQSGYTLDDNARALIAVVGYHGKYGKSTALRLARIYLGFLEYSLSRPGHNNYIHHDRSFDAERNVREGLTDAYARGVYALAVAGSASHLPIDLRERAARLFREKFDLGKNVDTPRSIAFCIKALVVWLKHEPDAGYEALLGRYCGQLIALYERNSRPDWQWFEDTLSYSNGVLPEALFLAYGVTGNQQCFNIAKASLDFLVRNSFDGTVCVPVGQHGWFKRGEKKTLFDQQPEEVTALVLALGAAYAMSRDGQYRETMRTAFDWFLGNNVLGQIVYDQVSGGCYDGVGEHSINLNQGAESTISYVIARLALA